MKKALIHDWYYVNGGAEKVIHSFNTIWKDFEHYALVDFLNESDRDYILNGATVNTSFIQTLPTARSNHRKFLQLFPYAIEQFDLNEYDLVLSSSASIAKGVMTNQNQLHICYCHSPMRYAWDLYHQYLEESNFGFLSGMYAKRVLHKIRMWDVINSNRVDIFIANSNYIKGRIKKIYNRDAKVIYPPVDVNSFELVEQKEDYYFTASRMVPYKKIELIVRAFNHMPDKKLIVAGDGPEYKKIKSIARSNIELVGFLQTEKLKGYMSKARAFVFAAEEDFGIIPVEAQACGTPVIAYNKGGSKETVINGKTGLLFNHQTEKSIIDIIATFEKLEFHPAAVRQNAIRFSKERFEKEMNDFVTEEYNRFKAAK
ncbi:glycosyltransferase [Winogradskyella thalassocola]|uniref:Glycosyltransferase involved in cell wall bisynthesis n=1 Tax=Winogradskyella thalassocola TaxID=262004 RepID=A0A1G7WSS8_9FLAO|nr:glycosyltransferase [Winogradskyella thalassocola]SDG74959.1 Glycosyltransferase involved in cell wall bisynthesis [Winogradskyella thalassocola]